MTLTPSVALGFYVKHYGALEAINDLSGEESIAQLRSVLGKELAKRYIDGRDFFDRVCNTANAHAAEISREAERRLEIWIGQDLEGAAKLTSSKGGRLHWAGRRWVQRPKSRIVSSNRGLELGFQFAWQSVNWDTYVGMRAAKGREEELRAIVRNEGFAGAAVARELGPSWVPGSVRLASAALSVNRASLKLDREALCSVMVSSIMRLGRRGIEALLCWE